MKTKEEKYEEALGKALKEYGKNRTELKNKYPGMAVRELLSLPAAFNDIVKSPGYLKDWIQGKPIETNYEKYQKLFDKETGNTFEPRTKKEKLFAAGVSAGIPVPGAGKIKAASTLGKFAKSFATSSKTGVGSAVAGQHVLNLDPDNVFGAIAASALTPTTIKTAKKSISPIVEHLSNRKLNLLKKDKNVQEAVLKEVGKRQGSSGFLEPEDIGYDITASNKREYDKIQSEFNAQKKHLEKRAAELGKPNVDVTPIVSELYEGFHNLDNIKDRTKYLKSEKGKYLSELLGVSDKPVKQQVPLLASLAKRKDKGVHISFESAELLHDELADAVSGGKVIGDKTKRNLGRIKSQLREKIGDIFKEDPKTYAEWEDYTRSRSSFINKEIPKYNEIMKDAPHIHKGKQYHAGDPTAAFGTTVKGEKNVITNPQYTDFVMNPMNPEESNRYSQALLKHLGKTEKGYNPLTAKKGLDLSQEKTRNRILEGLAPDERANIERYFPTLNEFEYTVNSPKHKILPFGNKIEKAIEFNNNRNVSQRKVNKLIDKLDKNSEKRLQRESFDNMTIPEKILSRTTENMNTVARPTLTGLHSHHGTKSELNPYGSIQNTGEESDEELMKMAGISDTSSMSPNNDGEESDEELMKMAGLT